MRQRKRRALSNISEANYAVCARATHHGLLASLCVQKAVEYTALRRGHNGQHTCAREIYASAMSVESLPPIVSSSREGESLELWKLIL